MHGHDVLGGTKTQSMRTRSGVWRPLEGPLSMADRLALGHRGESEVHVEAREGRISTNHCGTRLVDLGQGCEIEVKISTDPESDTWSPGPDSNGVLKVSVGIGLDCLDYPSLKGPSNTSSLLLLMLGNTVSLLISAVGKGFGVVLSWILKDPCNYLSLLMSGVETRRCFEGSFLGVYGMVFYSARCGEKTFLVVSVVGLMVTGICFGIVLFLHWSTFVRVLNSEVLLIWISLTGHVVFSGMGGYLLFLVVLLEPLG